MNDAGALIQGVPTWWDPTRLPEQVTRTRDNLLARCSPHTYKTDKTTGLLLWGPPGTGKTSAACALAYSWAKTWRTAMFQDFSELMVKVRSAWRKDAKHTVEEILAELMKPTILVLDDVGKRAAPEEQETIGIIINGRLNKGTPTISTTNCMLNEPKGREEFKAACDSRVAERYRGFEINFSSMLNLRLHQGRANG